MDKELNQLKYIVAEVMEQDKKTRSSDKWLIIQVLRKMGFKIYVDYHELKEMPSFESITRSRRYWQNDQKLLLPTQEIGLSRDRLEIKYKEVFV